MAIDDDKAACIDIAQKIEHDVQAARKHRIINTWIQVVLMLMVATNFWRSVIISRAVRESVELAQEATTKSIQIRERQDTYRQQYLDYIKDMIDTMQELQDQNPKLKVPRAPVPHSLVSPNGDTTPYDLQQLQQTRPAPTPAPTALPRDTRHRKPRPTPTPKPFRWFSWKPIR